MRLSVSHKLFLVFATLAVTTVLLGGFVYVGLVGLQKSSADTQAVRDFQLQLLTLERFNRRLSLPDGEDPGAMLAREIETAKELIRRIARGQLEVGPEQQAALDRTRVHIQYYETAFRELYDKYRKEAEILSENDRLLAELSSRITDFPDILTELERLLTALRVYGTMVYQRRDPATIRELRVTRDRFAEAVGDPDLAAGAHRYVENVTQTYFNFLAIRDREEFLSKTGERFFQVAQETIADLAQGWHQRHRRLTTLIIGAVLVAVTLTLILWHGATRYLRRFLNGIRLAIDSIREERYEYPLPSAPDDEIGDLSLFMRDLAGALKTSRERLRASEEKYRALADGISDWVWELDAAGRYRYSNPSLREVLGYGPEELLGRSPLELTTAEGRDRMRRLLETSLADNRPVRAVEHRVVGKDGAPRTLESSWQTIVGADGAVIGLRGIDRDISDRKRAEEERSQLHAQLMQAQKMEAIGTLTGGVAHDFNNILQSISGYTELLLMRKAEDDPERERLSRIEEAARRAADLTRQLLVFGRKVESDRRPCDLNQEVRAACRLLERTIPKMIRLELDLAADLDPILADPTQIEQVVINLALNARDAMPGGGVLTLSTAAVELGAERSPQPPGLAGLPLGDYVRLTVVDTGEGMPPEVQEHIFEPFFTTKEVDKGTGLGLATVYGVVAQHEGRILCDSKVGGGTRFSIYFPAITDAVAAAPATVHAAPTPRGDGQKILVVDDEEYLLELACDILREAGYRVATAASGEAALAIFKEDPAAIAAVLLDLNMPGMGGRECLRQLRALDPEITVVVATGYAARWEATEGAAAPPAAFLQKPYRTQELLEVLARVAGAPEGSAAGQ